MLHAERELAHRQLPVCHCPQSPSHRHLAYGSSVTLRGYPVASLPARFSSEPRQSPRTNCIGIGGLFAPESVDGFNRNGWTNYPGMVGELNIDRFWLEKGSADDLILQMARDLEREGRDHE